MDRLQDIVKNSDKYWAHLSKEGNRKPELLSEHMDLVCKYAEKLSSVHGLKSVIERLIERVCSKDKVSVEVYKLFWKGIYCHDLGKINPNFQKDIMNNDNFDSIDSFFGSQHSFLGSYLFLGLVWRELDKELMECFFLSILFGYNISKHHASNTTGSSSLDHYLSEKLEFTDDEYRRNCRFYENYIIPNFENKLFKKRISDFNGIQKFVQQPLKSGKGSFSLYALLKLHYSLLTASDYLATMHYMCGWSDLFTDYGVLDSELRTKIITTIKTSKGYNRALFDELEGLNCVEEYCFKCPEKANNINLNILRKEMCAEVVLNIRKHKEAQCFFIEAPTGGGKTNLSMLAVGELLSMAEDIAHIYYVFPFTTLITQTAEVLKDTCGLSTDEMVELHSKASLDSKGDDARYGKDKKNYIDHLFSNYPVALMSHILFFDILKTDEKQKNYLLHRMANSVVVIDELQAYNPMHWDKIVYFIENYAELFNIRFVLMSATLPKIDLLSTFDNRSFVRLIENKDRYFCNPNFCNRVKADFSLMEVLKKPKSSDEKKEYLNDLADAVICKSEEYAENNEVHQGSVFAIVEFIFKSTATVFADVIDKKSSFFDDVFVLSGSILEPRRREIICYLKNKENRDRKILLITTQVVEAGVDIDMDLGFKDTSLVDSDEQLAGRINRNVNKSMCSLYLFDCDDAGVIYRKDLRYQILKEKGTHDFVKKILDTKSFDLLYNEVIENKHKRNASLSQDGFTKTYVPFVERLSFNEVHTQFKLIDANNVSVFVPIDIPVYIPNSGLRNFSESDIDYLLENKVYILGDACVSGEKIFDHYESIVFMQSSDFLDKKMSIKRLQSIMSQFSFSLLSKSKQLDNLLGCGSCEERLGYYYLSHGISDGFYNYEWGLLEESQHDAMIL